MRKSIFKAMSFLLVVAIMIPVAMLPASAATVYTDSIASVDQTDNGTTVGNDATQEKSTQYVDNVHNDSNNDVDVYVTQASTFNVKLPKTIILNGTHGETNSGAYEVEVEGNLASDEMVTVAPDASFAMSSAGKADISAAVEQSKTDFAYADGVRIDTSVKGTGTITASGMSAGEWHGQYQFNVNLGPITATKEWDISANQNGNVVMKYYAQNKTARISGLGDISQGASNPIIGGGLATLYLVGATPEIAYEIGAYLADPSNVPSDETIAFIMNHTKDGSLDISPENLVFDYDAENLIIEGSITDIGEEAFTSCSCLRNVVINIFNDTDNIELDSNIRTRAFSGCVNLENVKMLDGVGRIYEEAFAYCSNLANLTLSGEDLGIIGNGAFKYTGIKNVVIPNSVTTIEEDAFYDTDLESVKFGNSVQYIGNGAFAATELKNIELPASIRTIDKTSFDALLELETVKIPSGLQNITNSSGSLGTLFNNCPYSAIIYCQSQAVADMVTGVGTNAAVVVDPSQF